MSQHIIQRHDAIRDYNEYLDKQYKPFKQGMYTIPASLIIRKFDDDRYWYNYDLYLEDSDLKEVW